jgi:hypothetical protein
MTDPAVETIPPRAPEETSRWEDFVDIIFTPAEVFRRRQDQSFWPPALIISVLIGVIVFATFNAMLPAFDAEMSRGMARAMERNPQMTPDMAATMKKWSLTTARFSGLLTPIGILLLGAASWLLAKIVGARQTFGAALVVAAFCFFPDVFQWLVFGGQAMVADPTTLVSQYNLHVGPARFVDPVTTDPKLLAILGRLGLFTIWSYVLLAIGISVTGRVSWVRGAVASAIVWILPTLMAIRGTM